tara:strand:- start:608 stop:1348 length:741 start_codon:yes stop_codon:yes gene_type:complete
MSSNAKNFLSTLKELNDANTVKVKVPSTGKNAEFKLASVSQQKDLIRTAFDGVDGVITRTVAVNNIILENSVDDVEFLIIDKPAVLVALRKESIGSDIKIGDKTYDLNTLPAIKKSDVKLTDTLEHDGITVNVEVPTLVTDSEVTKKLAKEFAKYEAAAEKIKQSVDIVVAYESAKYVDTITVGEDEIKFSDISVTERKDIINNLPLALNNKIIDYIGSIKDVTDKALTVDKEVVVEFDASFLSSD